MDRPDEIINLPENYLPKQYYLLLKKVEFFCESSQHSKAIFVFDEVNEASDKKIAEAFAGFLYRSRLGKEFNRILETPLFVSSSITPAIQIADIFAGIIRHYYENSLHQRNANTEFEKWIKCLYEQIKKRLAT